MAKVLTLSVVNSLRTVPLVGYLCVYFSCRMCVSGFFLSEKNVFQVIVGVLEMHICDELTYVGIR